MAVVAVEDANDLGKVRAFNVRAGFGREGFECRAVSLSISLDSGGDVLVAKVKDGKGEVLRAAGDGGSDMRAAERETSAARRVNLIRDAADAEAIEIGLVRKR